MGKGIGMGGWGLALAALAACVRAAPTDIDLSARVEPSNVLVGEPIRYVITVTRPARARAS